MVRGSGRGRAFLPELGESGPAAGRPQSGPEPLQGRQQAEQEPEAQHRGAGAQPPTSRADVTQEALAAVGADGRHAEVDAGAGADRGAALVQGMAEVHQFPCAGRQGGEGRRGGRGLGRGQRWRAALTEAGRGRHRDAVVVRVRAHGRLQAVEVTVLIRAGEAHQGAGCGGREARQVTPVSGRGGPPSGVPPWPLPVRNPQSLVDVNGAIITLQTQAPGPDAQRGECQGQTRGLQGTSEEE